jgi:GxxExxY protein
MINEKYKYSELTSKIIGCAITVHKELGTGFQELIYQRALGIEFNDTGLSFEREKEMPVFFKGHLIGTRRVDFLVEDVVPVELKAIGSLDDIHLAQAINYLECYALEIGLLINFGSKCMEFKRLINSKFNQQFQRNHLIR